MELRVFVKLSVPWLPNGLELSKILRLLQGELPCSLWEAARRKQAVHQYSTARQRAGQAPIKPQHAESALEDPASFAGHRVDHMKVLPLLAPVGHLPLHSWRESTQAKEKEVQPCLIIGSVVTLTSGIPNSPS